MLPTNGTSSNGNFPSLLIMEDWPFNSTLKRLNSRVNGDIGHSYFNADLTEYADRYMISIDVPGISREDMDISMENNTLSIQIKREKLAEEEGAKYLHSGRWFGSTVQTITLPDTVSNDEVEAALKEGVLTIVLKKQPEKQARKIEIKALN